MSLLDGDAVPSTIDIGFAFVATRKFANETFTNGLTSQLQSAIGSECKNLRKVKEISVFSF